MSAFHELRKKPCFQLCDEALSENPVAFLTIHLAYRVRNVTQPIKELLNHSVLLKNSKSQNLEVRAFH